MYILLQECDVLPLFYWHLMGKVHVFFVSLTFEKIVIHRGSLFDMVNSLNVINSIIYRYYLQFSATLQSENYKFNYVSHSMKLKFLCIKEIASGGYVRFQLRQQDSRIYGKLSGEKYYYRYGLVGYITCNII